MVACGTFLRWFRLRTAAAAAWPLAENPVRRHGAAWSLAAATPLGIVVLAALLGASVLGRVGAQPPPARQPVRPEANAEESEERDDGLSLPNDRDKERQLDRVQRLVADGRWSDAAVILDDLLGSERDAFLRADEQSPTRRSVRAAATEIIAGLPRPGREAYQLLFRGRAERALRDALAADDLEGVVSVARRWFDTPAGRAAAIATAVRALEDDQPLLAAAWLERLAATEVRDERLEPTLTVMRSLARHLAGDPAAAALLETGPASSRGTVVVAGRELQVSGSAARGRDWLSSIANLAVEPSRRQPALLQPGGDPSRNGLARAERPLLVPRYRVPLTRHPQEGRLLEHCRRGLVDRDTPAIPAGMPLAVAGQLVVRCPLGIMGIDFESGKRLWLRSALPSGNGAGIGRVGDEDDRAAAALLAFDDATEGDLSSDGRLVFAVESPAVALRTAGAGGMVFPGTQPAGGGWSGGNTLSAYDVAARGEPRWRLPAGVAAEASATWYLGAPLVAGPDLCLLCEEKGEVRLEVRDAAAGTLKWSQPLAELDERRRISEPAARPRRIAGLAPSLGNGVLVCPLGGCVVAVDTTTRSLLWAHTYATVTEGPAPDAPVRGRRQAPAVESRSPVTRCRDSRPVISGDRVLLAPRDSDELICLDLFTGSPAWPTFPRGTLHVAGVVDDRVIAVDSRGVEALSLRTGRRIWRREFGVETALPSGRGVLTSERLFVPLDTPEVLEIALADGTIQARCPARGDAVPGNLAVYRGELISRSAEAVAVFHQAPVLQSRVETALRAAPADPWALRWAGELALERGDVDLGLSSLRRAARHATLPPGTLAEAAVFGMRRDFAAAAAAWREAVEEGPLPTAARDAIRVAVDGFTRAGDLATAWDACRSTLLDDRGPERDVLATDPADPRLSATDDAWLRGRIADLVARAPADLRRRIDADLAALLERTLALAEPARTAMLERLTLRVPGHPVADEARSRLDALPGTGDGRRDFLLLARAQAHDPALRAAARREIGRILAPAIPPADVEAAWPLGRVIQRRTREDRAASRSHTRLLPLEIEHEDDSFVPGISLAFDSQQGRLHVLDGRGAPVTEPISCEPAAARLGLPWLPHSSGFQAACLGRVLFIRIGDSVAAYDLTAATPGSRCLWSRSARGGRGGEAAVVWGHQRSIAARMPRGGEPLGGLLPAPDEPILAAAIRGGRPRVTGIPSPSGTMLAMLDPRTGDVLWERRRLPPSATLFGDDEVLCVCPPDGRDTLVLSMLDGRLLGTCDLPPRQRRLATWGRRLVAVEAAGGDDGAAVVPRVRLVLHDPAAAGVTVLGECSGNSRATPARPGELALLEPSGDLSVFAVSSGAVVFRTRLPDMPRPFQQLRVMPWQDRDLVFAAGVEAAAGERPDQVSPLQQALIADEPSLPLSGSLWAVDRSTGELLWPAPATVEAHCLHPAQPADLPVLVFCRQIQPRHDPERLLLSILCLDKRTGHAVLEEDRIPAQPHVLFGLDVTGDPRRHTIELREIGAAGRVISLLYSGSPTPPQPPHQRPARTDPVPAAAGR